MNTDNNNVSFNFRSYTENRDTDISVCIDGDHVDDIKLARLLTIYLGAIGSRITLNVN
jgi:hypothetical protein